MFRIRTFSLRPVVVFLHTIYYNRNPTTRPYLKQSKKIFRGVMKILDYILRDIGSYTCILFMDKYYLFGNLEFIIAIQTLTAQVPNF